MDLIKKINIYIFVITFLDGTELLNCCMEPGSMTKALTCGIEIHKHLISTLVYLH